MVRDYGTSNERLAVQEALNDVIRDEVDELKTAIKELTNQLTMLSAALNMSNHSTDGKTAELILRVDRVERAVVSMKSFVSGVSFAFGAAGALLVAVVDLSFKVFRHD